MTAHDLTRPSFGRFDLSCTPGFCRRSSAGQIEAAETTTGTNGCPLFTRPASAPLHLPGAFGRLTLDTPRGRLCALTLNPPSWRHPP